MKKVLILAYDFPPYVSVGGLRPYSWLQNLKDFGYEPIVVTRQWENTNGSILDYISASKSSDDIIEDNSYGTIIKTTYKPNLSNRLLLKHGSNKYVFLRKGLTAIHEFLQYFLPIGTKYNLYNAANKYLSEHKVDIILATGEPFVLFKYAQKLSDKYEVPWVADYRDPWSQNELRTKYFPFKQFIPFIEKKICSKASLITTVSPFFKNQINSLLPKAQIEIISNGYNHEALKFSEGILQKSDKLRFAYVGTIYNWHPLKETLNAFYKLFNKGQVDFEVHFYGVNIVPELEFLIKTNFPKLKNHIFIYPKLENNLLFKELAQINVLLLFNDYSIIGTKIFDYLALKRKILLCFINDQDSNELKKLHYTYDESLSSAKNIQREVLIKTNSGIALENANDLFIQLEKLYTEFKKDKYIKCDSKNVEEFSRKNQTKKLASLLNMVIKNNLEPRPQL